MPADATLQTWKPLPFDEAVKFWRSKRRVSSSEFERMTAQAKARAFAVAGVAKSSFVSDIYQALDRAVSNGTAFGDFRRDIRHIIAAKGWTGKRGFRVQTIFRTNVQTAYNVGKYQQFMEAKDDLPYWQYDAVGDSRTRPSHAALDGKVFRADDPIWDTWYPPNGFNCRCTVRALSRAEVRARGLTVETGRESLDRGFVDEAGRSRQYVPDPGWATNPGKDWFGGITATAIQTGGSLRPMPGQPTAKDFGLPSLSEIDAALLREYPADRILQDLSDQELERVFMETFGTEESADAVIVDILGQPVIINHQLLAHLLGRSGHAEVMRLIPEVLQDPFEVWLTAMRGTDPAGPFVLRRHYIQLWKQGPKHKGMLVVVHVDNDICTGWTAFAADESYLDRRRMGKPLYLRYLRLEHKAKPVRARLTGDTLHRNPAARRTSARPLRGE